MFLRGKVSGPLSPASLRANKEMGEGRRVRERGQTQKVSMRWVHTQQTDGGPRLETTQNGVSRKGIVLSDCSRPWFLDSGFQLRRARFSLPRPTAG